jgi:hypothetical protein
VAVLPCDRCICWQKPRCDTGRSRLNLSKGVLVLCWLSLYAVGDRRLKVGRSDVLPSKARLGNKKVSRYNNT